jgi:hypothetical protein
MKGGEPKAGWEMKELWVKFGLIFAGMVMAALVVTGVFQEGIWPRVKPMAKWAYGKWQPEPDRPETKRVVVTRATPSIAQGIPAEALLADPAPAPKAVPAGDRGSGIGDRGVKAAGGMKEDQMRLARLYSGMRPRDAASIVEKLDPSLATEILTRIPDRQAARILGAMDPEIAARLTRGIGMTKGGGPQAGREIKKEGS